MQIVLATDIFGETKWTQAIVVKWRKQGHQVLSVSPYEELLQFAGESEAYAQFTEAGGFDAYCHKITRLHQEKLMQSQALYIGFSAGGAALWRVLSEVESGTQSHLIAFYPGQIRHHLDLSPKVATSLVFPKQEQHFDLSPVIEYLVTKPEVNIIQNGKLHGYANPESDQYDQSASSKVFDLLCDVSKCANAASFSRASLLLSEDHKIVKSITR